MSDRLLERCLSCAVPMWVEHLKNKPIDWLVKRKESVQIPKEFIRKNDNAEYRSMASIIGERGDNLLYGGSVRREAGFLFNTLAEGIAILSLICPGGVDFGDLHFENPHKDLKK